MEAMFKIMMKNLGINPEEVMGQVKAFAEATQKIADTIQRIEAKQDRVIEQNEALNNRLAAIERHIGMSVKPTLTIEGK